MANHVTKYKSNKKKTEKLFEMIQDKLASSNL